MLWGSQTSLGSYSGTSYTTPTYGVVGAAPFSVTHHDRHLEIEIRDQKGKSVFEGRANSTGTVSDIAGVLPQMIDSMFTEFPGESGKTERIEKKLP